MKPKEEKSRLTEVIAKYESDSLADWLREQLEATTLRGDLMKESELREQSRQFLKLIIRAASQPAGLNDVNNQFDQAHTTRAIVGARFRSRRRRDY